MSDLRRLTLADLRRKRASGEALVAVSLYDACFARLADEAVDIILVGDSLGMTVLGHGSTVPVTLDDMVSATAAVVRGSRRAFIVADLPFGTYQASPAQALESSARLLRAGAQAVKMEGGAFLVPQVELLVRSGIPVMGHIGVLPQSVNVGGYRAKGRDEAESRLLLEDALALQQAGAFSLVLECVGAAAAASLSSKLEIPSIGIGSGLGCSGQIQVMHDILGLDESFLPRHAQRFAELGRLGREAFASYAQAVRNRHFPAPGNTY
ncbi:MAG: hypothetical protein RL095_3419 [Verrucomicrobiota bacterium]|jgi:3-methyl-2-oxobutanoate hydroxymethyltransferase